MMSLLISIILTSTVTIKGDELKIDGTALSLFVHSENEVSFTTNLPTTDNTTWCLFYNFNDISNHLYCISSSTQTECHTLNDQHYTFKNISLCNTDLNNNDISSLIPIVGRVTDKYVCKIYYDLCCKLSTTECATNTNNKNNVNANINDNTPTLTLPLNNDGFLHFTDTSMTCIGTNDAIATCNSLPQISPTDNMILFDSIFISQTALLILFTDDFCTSLLIQKCTIFTANPTCEILPQISITNTANSDNINDKNDIKINVIAYDECNLLISRISDIDGDISSLYVYDYCNNELNEININSKNIYNSLNNYIAHYHNMYNNEITCFILFENDFSINCLSISLETVRVPTISPTNPPQVSVNNNINSSQSTNGLGPFSDASFITIVVVGGIVIVSCLVCGVVCFTKYQKEKLRQEWYKQREMKKNKRNKKRQKKNIIPPNGSEISLCSNTMNTMNTNTFMTSRNGNYTESEYEESTIKLSNHKAKLPNKKRLGSQSNSSSFIRAKSYPRLPPKIKVVNTNGNKDNEAAQVDVLYKSKRRKTSISHRSLYQEEGGAIDDETNTDVTHYNPTYSMGDITPLDLDKNIEIVIAEKDRKVKFSTNKANPKSKIKYQLVPIKKNDRKQISSDTTTTTTTSLYLMPSSTDSSYDGESSPSSQTIEFHDGVQRCLTRPSLHFSTPIKSSNSTENLEINDDHDNMASELSILSRCSFENNETEEKNLIETHVSTMPTPGGGNSGLACTYKQFRINPRITRRMTASGSVNYKKYQYHNLNMNEMDSEDSEKTNVDTVSKNEIAYKFRRKQTVGPNINYHASKRKKMQKYELSTSTTVESSFQL